MRLGLRLHPPQPQGITDQRSFLVRVCCCGVLFLLCAKKSRPTRKLKKNTILRALPPYLFISFSVQIFVDGVVAQNNLFVWIDFRVARVVEINICQYLHPLPV